MLNFRDELVGLNRLVVKVGSNVITKSNGRCDSRKLRIIVEDICELIDQGIEVVLVSSGSVSLGKHFLKKYLPKKGRIDLQQSASSIGQPKLINTYSRLFEENHKICSQILLIHDDFRNRRRFLHAKQNIETLLRNGVTPILNENDSVSYHEISVGDNDHLAAQTAQMVNADALLVITSAKGLYNKDPEHEDAKLIKNVEFGESYGDIDMKSKTAVGRGGMSSKVHAVNKVTQLGIKAIISSKDNERIIMDPLLKSIGTFFCPKKHYCPENRKAWLLSMKKQACYIDVDQGAYKALLKGKSLFPKGILDTSGDFYRGDCIALRYGKKVFASGISEYDQSEIEKIKQYHSDDIEQILGFKFSSEVIQTNNLVINKEKINERISKEIEAS